MSDISQTAGYPDLLNHLFGKVMNPPLQNLDLLENLVVNLNIRWRLFTDVFQSSDRVGLFQQSGIGVWEVLMECTLDAILMDISRLMDPKQSMGRANLSFEAVLPEIPRTGFTKDMDNDLVAAKKIYAELIKPWRNRRLGHNDLETLTTKSALPDIPYSRIDDLMEMINRIMRNVALTTRNVDVRFEPAIAGSDWAARLFLILKEGLKSCQR